MAQETIDFGSYPNDANADPVRVAFQKVQNNITELFSVSVSDGVRSVTTGPGLSQDFSTGNIRIVANIPSITIQTADSLLVGVGIATGRTATINTSGTPFYIDVAPTITTSNVVATNLTGTLTTPDQPSITSVGNLVNLNVDGNIVATTLYANVFSTFVSAPYISAPGSNTHVLLNTNGLIDTDARLTFTGNTLRVLANIQTNNANLGNVARANFVTGTLTTAAQPNVTSVGTLTSLSVTGNLASGNADLGNAARANFFIGNGHSLTSLTGANVTGVVANANYSAVAGMAITSSLSTVATTVTNNAQPNITSTGTLTTLNVSGLSSVAEVNSSGNLIVDGYITADQASFTGNLRAANAILGVTASAVNFVGNGSALSNITGANVTGNVAKSILSYRSYVTTTATGFHYIPFVDNTVGNSAIRTNPNLYYNALTNRLTTTSLQVIGSISSGSLNTNGGTVAARTLTTGSPTTTGTIIGTWSLSEGSRLEATFADLAECYSADQTIEPGTVVEFGGEKEVRICDSLMSKTIAGVITTNPAYVMNSMIKCEYPVSIALQGRVPVKVTGSIRKGDMLVSAGGGRATAISAPMIGTVIGKSLQDFDGDEGIIEVAVGRL